MITIFNNKRLPISLVTQNTNRMVLVVSIVLFICLFLFYLGLLNYKTNQMYLLAQQRKESRLFLEKIEELDANIAKRQTTDYLVSEVDKILKISNEVYPAISTKYVQVNTIKPYRVQKEIIKHNIY